MAAMSRADTAFEAVTTSCSRSWRRQKVIWFWSYRETDRTIRMFSVDQVLVVLRLLAGSSFSPFKWNVRRQRIKLVWFNFIHISTSLLKWNKSFYVSSLINFFQESVEMLGYCVDIQTSHTFCRLFILFFAWITVYTAQVVFDSGEI